MASPPPGQGTTPRRSRTHLLPDDTPVRFSQDRLPDANDLHRRLPCGDASHPSHDNVSDLDHLISRSSLLRLGHLRRAQTSHTIGSWCGRMPPQLGCLSHTGGPAKPNFRRTVDL